MDSSSSDTSNDRANGPTEPTSQETTESEGDRVKATWWQMPIRWAVGPPIDPFSPDAELSKGSASRLGIVHLMVFIGCVAVCLGADEIVVSAIRSGEVPIGYAAFLLYSVLGWGASLAGFLLWVARRVRGWPFPVYPGEYLLAVQGIAAVTWLIQSFRGVARDYSWTASTTLSPVSLLAIAILAVALVRIRSVGWRLCFATAIVMCLKPVWYYSWGWLAMMLAQLPLEGSLPWIFLVADSLTVFVLASVSWTEYRQGRRYPWTHWLGVGLVFWFSVPHAVSLASRFIAIWIK